jgi:6-phosphogluconate dehydrogenase
VSLAVNSGVPTPGFSASLSYFDTYRRERLPANLVQVGSHMGMGLRACDGCSCLL